MSRILFKFLFSFGLFLFFSTTQAAETYKLDPQHSYVLWHINHFGFSNPSGKWMVEGTLTLDEEKPQNSKVNASIQVAEMITGIPKLDEHLKGKLFFNVTQFPKATFTSQKIEVINKKTAKVYGILTLHGVSKPITLNVILNQIAESPISNKKTAGFTASTQLKRSDFGINGLLPGVGDDVKIDIEVEAFKD